MPEFAASRGLFCPREQRKEPRTQKEASGEGKGWGKKSWRVPLRTGHMGRENPESPQPQLALSLSAISPLPAPLEGEKGTWHPLASCAARVLCLPSSGTAPAAAALPVLAGRCFAVCRSQEGTEKYGAPTQCVKHSWRVGQMLSPTVVPSRLFQQLRSPPG